MFTWWLCIVMTMEAHFSFDNPVQHITKITMDLHIKPATQAHDHNLLTDDTAAQPTRKKARRDGGRATDVRYREMEREELEDLLRGHLPDFYAGMAAWNASKNRYSNNLPLDRTRVLLDPRKHLGPGSDYINANHILPLPLPSAPSTLAEHIAAQAPLEHTRGDFWRMIYEQRTHVVVMLTRLWEGTRAKAKRYWPRTEGVTVRYGEILVRLVSVRSYYGSSNDELIIRRFLIRQDRDQDQAGSKDDDELTPQDGEWHHVVQLHYQGWSDFGRPQSCDHFLELLRLVEAFHHASCPSSPIVVHCSAGLGRTGVFIAAHMAMQAIQFKLDFDVSSIVRHIRKQRPGMVQTSDQFAFIHEAVEKLISERPEIATRGNFSSAL